MRWMLLIALLLPAGGCRKTIHEARAPANAPVTVAVSSGDGIPG